MLCTKCYSPRYSNMFSIEINYFIDFMENSNYDYCLTYFLEQKNIYLKTKNLYFKCILRVHLRLPYLIPLNSAILSKTFSFNKK